jgi:hypothetical protein
MHGMASCFPVGVVLDRAQSIYLLIICTRCIAINVMCCMSYFSPCDLDVPDLLCREYDLKS